MQFFTANSVFPVGYAFCTTYANYSITSTNSGTIPVVAYRLPNYVAGVVMPTGNGVSFYDAAATSTTGASNLVWSTSGTGAFSAPTGLAFSKNIVMILSTSNGVGVNFG